MGSRFTAAAQDELVNRIASSFLFVALLLSSGESFAEQRTADEHLRRGLELYAAKDYEGAIAEFRAGYDLDPKEDFLFSWAQAERLSGDCQSALALYQRYLDRQPSKAAVDAALFNKEKCEEALATKVSRPTTMPTTAPMPVAEPVKKDPDLVSFGPEIEDRPPWYRDAAGAILATGSVLGMGMGLAFHLESRRELTAADRATVYEDFVGHVDRAESIRLASTISIGVGAVLAAAAAGRYLLVARPASPPRVTAWIGEESGLVLWGEF